MRYADDTTLIATTKEDLVELIRRVEVASREVGLKLNRQKTKVMIIDRKNNNQPDTTRIANCEVVSSFVYLGAVLSNGGGSSNEIRRRIEISRSAMSRLTKVWRDRQISNATKMRLVKSLVFSIFLYGAETWTVLKKDRDRINAFEMWCWRRLLRIPWTARRTNASILGELGVRYRLDAVVSDRILRYFGHTMRRERGLERTIVEGRVLGVRPRGRSPSRWVDQIKALTGIPLRESRTVALDREVWRLSVNRALLSTNHDASAMRQAT